MFEIRACEYSIPDDNHVQMVGSARHFSEGRKKSLVYARVMFGLCPRQSISLTQNSGYF